MTLVTLDTRDHCILCVYIATAMAIQETGASALDYFAMLRG